MLFHFFHSTTIRSLRLLFTLLLFLFAVLLSQPPSTIFVLSRPVNPPSGLVSFNSLKSEGGSPALLKSMVINETILSQIASSSGITDQELAKKAFKMLEVEEAEIPNEQKQLKWIRHHRKRKHQRGGRLHGAKSTNDDVIIRDPGNLNKQENCSGDEFIQRVRYDGCKAHYIKNRFCHGTCASFYIPKLRSKKLKGSSTWFSSCAACVPSETEEVQVRLKCPHRVEKEISVVVRRVKRCACRNIDFNNEDTLDYELLD